jgi:Tol biopolymer transport system component
MPGVAQRRLTHTEGRLYPGIQGVRHWLRSSPSGDQIALLMKDDEGVSQIWTVSPATSELKQLTRNQSDISSTFTWSPNGLWIAHGMAGRVCLTSSSTGKTYPVTSRRDSGQSPVPSAGEMRPESCVISPDGSSIAFVRSRSEREGRGTVNQICVVELEKPLN